MNTNGQPEKRSTRRHTVGLPAECALGRSVAYGIVRDITSAGVFVAYDREGDRELLQRPAGLKLERLLHVGARLLLTLLETPVMNRRVVPATVCWQGFSDEHRCDGYGVRYDLS